MVEAFAVASAAIAVGEPPAVPLQISALLVLGVLLLSRRLLTRRR